MAIVKAIKKTSAENPDHFDFEFSCNCSDGGSLPNIRVTSTSETDAGMLAQRECDARCLESVTQTQSDETPVKNINPLSASAVPVVGPFGSSYWSRSEGVYWDGYNLYGWWINDRDLACGAVGLSFFAREQIADGPYWDGACAVGPLTGASLTKVVSR